MADKEVEKRWTDLVKSVLVGHKIVEVSYLPASVAENKFGWGNRPIVIRLDNGVDLVPMADDEGNNGGAIATNAKRLSTIPVLSL